MPAPLTRSALFRILPFFLLLGSCFLAGCGGKSGQDPGPGISRPEIHLEPSQADFGVVVLGKSSEKHFTVRNTGNGNLLITGVQQPDNGFRMVTDNCSGSTLPPSSSCSLTVRFAPTAQDNYFDSFTITSNDGDEGNLAATVVGKGRSLGVSIDSVGSLNTPLQTVTIAASVIDRQDSPMVTLTDNNFSLYENGEKREIVGVSNVVDVPVSTCLLLDYSSTMLDYTPGLESAAKKFVDQLDAASDEAEIVKFAMDIAVMQPFTSDKDALKSGIDNAFPFPRFGTMLFDSLWYSIESVAGRDKDRRVVVAVSDGEDAGSAKNMEGVIQDAIGKNVALFTIGIGTVSVEVMQQLAARTGGQYFYSPTGADLEGIYTKISEILSNQYRITYKTSSPGGTSVSIDLMVDKDGERGECSIADTI